MNEVTVVVGGILIFFGMLIGACVYGDNQKFALQMECTKQHGDWIDRTCIYRHQQ